MLLYQASNAPSQCRSGAEGNNSNDFLNHAPWIIRAILFLMEPFQIGINNTKLYSYIFLNNPPSPSIYLSLLSIYLHFTPFLLLFPSLISWIGTCFLLGKDILSQLHSHFREPLNWRGETNPTFEMIKISRQFGGNTANALRSAMICGLYFSGQSARWKIGSFILDPYCEPLFCTYSKVNVVFTSIFFWDYIFTAIYYNNLTCSA